MQKVAVYLFDPVKLAGKLSEHLKQHDFAFGLHIEQLGPRKVRLPGVNTVY